jgi:hypothetical protein
MSVSPVRLKKQIGRAAGDRKKTPAGAEETLTFKALGKNCF